MRKYVFAFSAFDDNEDDNDAVDVRVIDTHLSIARDRVSNLIDRKHILVYSIIEVIEP